MNIEGEKIDQSRMAQAPLPPAGMLIRPAAARLLDTFFWHTVKPMSERDLAASALVLAPHPDDETLGCGGLIAKKLRSGVPVKIAVLTDGAGCGGCLSSQALRARREAEAVEAAIRLGASSTDVIFLRFPDGAASAHRSEMAAAIAELLRSLRPQCLLVPHAFDPHADHVAVNQAARLAIGVEGRGVTLFEYPVWLWYHWPWVGLFGDLPSQSRLSVRQTARMICGLRMRTLVDCRLDIGDVLEIKRAALAAHVSQCERTEDNPDGPVLSDLARGAFLERLLSSEELFRRTAPEDHMGQ